MLPRIAVAGHVDDGKSTLLGRLLLETDSLYPEEVAEMHRSNERWNHPSEHLASLTDGLIEEREQGITVEVAHRWFNLGPKDEQALLLDCPGHLEFKTATLGAMTQCSVLLLVSDLSRPCSPTALWLLETAIQLGVFQVVVALTKSDLVDDLPTIEAARIAELQEQVGLFQERLKQLLELDPETGQSPESGRSGAVQKPVQVQFQSISALTNRGINGAGELLDKLRQAAKNVHLSGEPEPFQAVGLGPRTMIGHNRLFLGVQVLSGEVCPNDQLQIRWPKSGSKDSYVQTVQVSSVYAPPAEKLETSRGRQIVNLELTLELPELLSSGPPPEDGAVAVYAGAPLEASRFVSALLLPLITFEQMGTNRNLRLQTESQHTTGLMLSFRERPFSRPAKALLILEDEIILNPNDFASPWNRGCLYNGHTFEAIALIVNIKAYHQGAS
jgi:signal recognition particle receptor subunit beta